MDLHFTSPSDGLLLATKRRMYASANVPPLIRHSRPITHVHGHPFL